MNVEIWAEAALFPEKEYINGIALAVCLLSFFVRDILALTTNDLYCVPCFKCASFEAPQIPYSIRG
jgi:hypothetical protein